MALGLAVARPDECDVEDLACSIRALGVAGVGGVIGSAAGVVLAGRSVNSRPSPIGAFIGSLGGLAGGLGLVHLLTEEVNVRLEKPGVLLVFTLTQGVTAALGSRLGAAIRDG